LIFVLQYAKKSNPCIRLSLLHGVTIPHTLFARILNENLRADSHVFLQDVLLNKNPAQYAQISTFDLNGQLLIGLNSLCLTNDICKDGITIELSTFPETVKFNFRLKILNERTFRDKYSKIGIATRSTIQNAQPNEIDLDADNDRNDMDNNIVLEPNQIFQESYTPPLNNISTNVLNDFISRKVNEQYVKSEQRNKDLQMKINDLNNRIAAIENNNSNITEDNASRRRKTISENNNVANINQDTLKKRINTLTGVEQSLITIENVIIKFYHDKDKPTSQIDFVNYLGMQADVCFKRNEKIFVEIKNQHQFPIEISVSILDSTGEEETIFPTENNVMCSELSEKGITEKEYTVIAIEQMDNTKSSNFINLIVYICNKAHNSSIIIIKSIAFT